MEDTPISAVQRLSRPAWLFRRRQPGTRRPSARQLCPSSVPSKLSAGRPASVPSSNHDLRVVQHDCLFRIIQNKINYRSRQQICPECLRPYARTDAQTTEDIMPPAPSVGRAKAHVKECMYARNMPLIKGIIRPIVTHLRHMFAGHCNAERSCQLGAVRFAVGLQSRVICGSGR